MFSKKNTYEFFQKHVRVFRKRRTCFFKSQNYAFRIKKHMDTLDRIPLFFPFFPIWDSSLKKIISLIKPFYERAV